MCQMEVVYRALSGSPQSCVEFYGITVLRGENPMTKGPFLVFERATGESIDKFIESKGSEWIWEDILRVFSEIASGLWDGLHSKMIAHGYKREKYET